MVIDNSQPLWITDNARRYATDDDVMLLPYKHDRFSASSRQISVREAIQQRQSVQLRIHLLRKQNRFIECLSSQLQDCTQLCTKASVR